MHGKTSKIQSKKIGKFFKSVFGKKIIGEAVEGATKTTAKTGFKGALKSLGPIGIGIELALAPLFAYFDFKDRKKEGQTDKEAKMGAGGTVLGGLAGTLAAMVLIPEPFSSAAGLIGLTKSLSQEVATRNITVNCIAPGFIETPMTEQLDDKRKDEILNSIPMNRIGTPEDLSSAIIFLASQESSYITGQTIHINGGLYMN